VSETHQPKEQTQTCNRQLTHRFQSAKFITQRCCSCTCIGILYVHDTNKTI